MRYRCPNSSNLESARVPSVLYYDHNGNFRGVLKGVDFQDSDALIKVKWWEAVLHSPVQNTDSESGGR